MKNTAKVAISIPVSTLKSLERARARLRKTRSAAITEAIQHWLAAEALGDDDRAYIEGYLKHPERIDELTIVAESAVGVWEHWQ